MTSLGVRSPCVEGLPTFANTSPHFPSFEQQPILNSGIKLHSQQNLEDLELEKQPNWQSRGTYPLCLLWSRE